MIKVAVVKHNNNTMEYVFKTDLDLESGDLVVCDTQRGYETARVLRTQEVKCSDAKKWIVCKVDLGEHISKVNKENRIKNLKEKIDSKRKNYSSQQINTLIGQVDSEMASLLQKLESLQNGRDHNMKEFFFVDLTGKKFKALLRDDRVTYSIKSTFSNEVITDYDTDIVRGCLANGAWKIIG
ncbi:hypothetical protein BSK59_13860 [Paenibacillus odorifer]|uniref:hypothetical protein n=1 Tax=Paenibacillus odorifer TaxID=189426 RepID=UPI00096E5829|nr:hypothetical protein [Paenibacillus odorifer]OME55556.1 hypothetical protein BSK59_13860 [Paenibacillus odorifer]